MKLGHIANLRLDQLRWEMNTMKRLLSFIMEENIYFKYRLSEVLKTGFNKKQLEQLEDFQTRFIVQDEFIALLNNQIAELSESLPKEIVENRDMMQRMNAKIIKVGNNISLAEDKYKKLKNEFNNYLSANIQ